MKADINTNATTADFEFAALSEAANYRRALIGEMEPYLSGKVIEVGSGIGQMTELIARIPAVTFLQCVEPDSRFCQEFKRLRPSNHLLQGTVADVKETDWKGIVSINVLEHIEEDQAELRMYHDKLRAQKGILNLFVPARPELYAPIDKDFGHFRRYTKADLRTKLEKAGFRIESIRYYNCVGYFAWWVNFCLLKRRGFDKTSVRFFDRVIFPVVHALETGLWAPPFGQSLLVVARAV